MNNKSKDEMAKPAQKKLDVLAHNQHPTGQGTAGKDNNIVLTRSEYYWLKLGERSGKCLSRIKKMMIGR